MFYSPPPLPESPDNIFNRRLFIISFILYPFLQKTHLFSHLSINKWVLSEFSIKCKPNKISKIIYPQTKPSNKDKYKDLINNYKNLNYLIQSHVDFRTSPIETNITYRKLFKNQKACDLFITDYFLMHNYKDSMDYFEKLKANKIKYTYLERSLDHHESIHKKYESKILI